MQALVARPARRRFLSFWNLLLWFAPVLFAFWLYADGLDCWFILDDFAWLGLLRTWDSTPGNLLRLLFEPAAQGTIRPFSERGFFMLFEALFGLDSLPFRIAAFTVISADLLLVGWVMRRLTGSAVAGTSAGIVWIANASLVTVMTWNSAFNEALCPFFLLSALVLFVRYIETGHGRWWWWQLVVFTLGFGVLENNIVYPALAAAWVLFVVKPERRRSLLLSLVPLFVISAIYYAIHRWAVDLPHSGPYRFAADRRLFTTLGLYCKWLLLPNGYQISGMRPRIGTVVLVICTSALLILAVQEWRARRTQSLFFVAWFLITLGPLLPLPDHRSEYYLTIPALGLGMASGFALAAAKSRAAGMAVALPLVVYLATMIPVARRASEWTADRGEAVRNLVEGVEAASDAHPGRMIVVQDVDSGLFNDAVRHAPFYPLGIDNFYLTPGSERKIRNGGEPSDLYNLLPDRRLLADALQQHKAVVYSVAGDHLRNITAAYERSAPNLLRRDLPVVIDAGDPVQSEFLGPEWLPLEPGFRWMPSHATLRIHGPGPRGGSLVIDGYCPETQLQHAARHVRILVNGNLASETRIFRSESTFHRRIPLPRNVDGLQEVVVEIQVEPTVRRNGKEYGLRFGRIAVEPGVL